MENIGRTFFFFFVCIQIESLQSRGLVELTSLNDF